MNEVKYYSGDYDSNITIEVYDDKFEVVPKYSDYEDCVDLVLYKNGVEILRVEEIFVGYTDS